MAAKTVSRPSRPPSRKPLALHIDGQRHADAADLFESSRHKPYSERGVRTILAAASGPRASPPRSARTSSDFLVTWPQGLDDALIQLCGGRASRESLEVYSRLAPRLRPAELRGGHRQFSWSDQHDHARLRQ